MADNITFGLQGVDEVMAKIESVQNDIRYKGGRAALRKAANLVRDAAKQTAQGFDDPKTARSIVKNLAVRWSGRRFKATGDLMFRVGVMKGARLQDGGDLGAGAATPHFRLLEFGTEKMKSQAFLRPALAHNKEKAASVFVSEYSKAIDRALKRAEKKAKK